jgi:hypothetical protein
MSREEIRELDSSSSLHGGDAPVALGSLTCSTWAGRGRLPFLGLRPLTLPPPSQLPQQHGSREIGFSDLWISESPPCLPSSVSEEITLNGGKGEHSIAWSWTGTVLPLGQ